MAELQNGSPLPNGTAKTTSPSKNPPQGLSQSSRNNNRHTKNLSHPMPQVDGTVSDSVTNPMASPRSQKAPKQRQQSVAISALPKENGNTSKSNGGKARPVSIGGNMLPATPAKEQAYAGPTFQASPAPSSLPVPKFFSRSVPNVAAQQKSLGARIAGEHTPDAERSSPEPEVVAAPRDAQMSPLDVFFKADAAERETTRSASMQSPELARRAQVPPATDFRNPFQQAGKSVFLREMDSSNDILSPKPTSLFDRPPPPQRASSSGTDGPYQNNDDQRETYTKSLKDILFNVDVTPPKTAPQPGPPRSNSNPRNSGSPFETPSPFQRSASGPSTPTPFAEQQNHYSLHYGNRNLSPLFKAARNDTPPSRPSGLRQQELASDLSPTAGRQSQPPQIDPDSFSRTYLDQTIRASQPATLPSIPLSNSTNSSNLSSSNSASQRGVSVNGSSPRTGSGSGPASQDIRTMEDDLKRMLKINVLSN